TLTFETGFNFTQHARLHRLVSFIIAKQSHHVPGSLLVVPKLSYIACLSILDNLTHATSARNDRVCPAAHCDHSPQPETPLRAQQHDTVGHFIKPHYIGLLTGKDDSVRQAKISYELPHAVHFRPVPDQHEYRVNFRSCDIESSDNIFNPFNRPEI